jgi:integration host factor subunit alpha
MLAIQNNSNDALVAASAFTKADLTKTLIERNQLPKREARHLVELFFEEIRVALFAGNDVKLSNFGTFEVRHKTPRPGRNPRTGELVPIAARTVVTFQPSIKLKEKLEQVKS